MGQLFYPARLGLASLLFHCIKEGEKSIERIQEASYSYSSNFVPLLSGNDIDIEAIVSDADVFQELECNSGNKRHFFHFH